MGLTSRVAVRRSNVPTVLGSALTAQNENEGVQAFSATADVGTAGASIFSWVGILTSLFAGPPTGNNGNTHTQVLRQAYGGGFDAYSLALYRSYNASGTSNHSVSGSKPGGTEVNDEVTIAILVLSGGTIVDSDVTVQAAAGAGHTFTSGQVTTTGAALLVGFASGDGTVNATAPTQTWEAGWNVEQFVARNAAQSPDGHVPLYIATKPVYSAGNYDYDVTMTINEGGTFGLFAVQL